MKSALFVVFTLTAGVVVLAGDSKDDDLMDLLISTLPENYKNIDKHDHVAYAKSFIEDLAQAVCVEGKTMDAQGIAKEVVKGIKEVDTGKDTICATIQKHLVKVMNPLVEALDNCIDPEMKGATKTFMRTVVSIFGQTCKMDGEHLMELGNPCRMKIDIKKCVPDVDSLVRNAKTEIVKLIKTFNNEVCTMYNKERSCLENQVKTNCKLSVTREAIMGLTDSAFKTPCTA